MVQTDLCAQAAEESVGDVYLISLYFDEKTNKILQRYIDRIAVETGNDFMTSRHVPPHITICQIEAKSERVLTPQMNLLQIPQTDRKVEFVSVGMLLPYVLYVTPVYNNFLHEMMLETNRRFASVPETKISRYYRPMSWLPHVTLGKKLDSKQMQKALKLMADNFAPFEGSVTEIGLAKVNPHEDVVRKSV